MPRSGQFWIAAILLILVSGCGDEGLGPDAGSITGRIMALDTRAPFEGARVFLFSPADNAPAVSPATTGSNGQYRFDDVLPGFYYLVVYAGHQIAFDTIEEAVEVRARRTTERNLLVAGYPLLPDGRIVSGVVRDARTGLPLEGAYVSVGTSDYPLFFGGTGLPWEAVTDRDGRFLLERVPTVTRGLFAVGLVPLVATKAGYLPGATGSSRLLDWLPLPGDGDTARVVLDLVPGVGAFSVLGRVSHHGIPVSGVAVALSFTDTDIGSAQVSSGLTQAVDLHKAWPTAMAGGLAAVRPTLNPASVAPELVAYSDAGGYFEIRHVAPGRYRLQVAYLPDDGWVQTPLETGFPEVVVRDESVTHVVASILPGIEYIDPGPGAEVSSGRPWFTWRRIPGASRYYLIFSRANSYILTDRIETADTTAQVAPGFWGNGDHARWTVLALHGGEIIAAGETISSFSVAVRP